MMTVGNPEIASQPGCASFFWFDENGNLSHADIPKACIKWVTGSKPPSEQAPECKQRDCRAILFTAHDLQSAYQDGFGSGFERGLSQDKMPMAVAWLDSPTRKMIGPVNDNSLLREFGTLHTAHRRHFNPPIEVLP